MLMGEVNVSVNLLSGCFVLRADRLTLTHTHTQKKGPAFVK